MLMDNIFDAIYVMNSYFYQRLSATETAIQYCEFTELVDNVFYSNGKSFRAAGNTSST